MMLSQGVVTILKIKKTEHGAGRVSMKDCMRRFLLLRSTLSLATSSSSGFQTTYIRSLSSRKLDLKP